mgnify:CR=1 FL=1
MPDDLDITYCTHYDCTNHDCMRHPSRIINHSLPRSFSDFDLCAYRIGSRENRSDVS